MKCQLENWTKKLEIYIHCRINSEYTLSIAIMCNPTSILQNNNELFAI